MVVFNRWVTLIAGMYMMMISGTVYLFPSYSDTLKTSLGYNVEQINFVGTMLNTGTWAGVIGGIFFDKYGPKLTSLVGAIIVFGGYFLMYLSASKTIGGSSVEMGLFAFLAGQGSGWFYTAALNTNAANFLNEDRGKILGVLTCCFGLCAGIFTLIYKSFFVGKLDSFLLFLAITIPASGLVFGSVFCNYLTKYPKNYQGEKNRVNVAYGIMATIVILICVTSLVTNFINLKPMWFTVGVLVLIGTLSFLVFGSEEGFTMSPTTASIYTLVQEPKVVDENSRSVRKWGPSSSPHQESVEIPLWRALLTLDFYLLFFCIFANIGSGITILNNLPQFVISLEDLPLYSVIDSNDLPYAKYATTFVILFSVFNTLGRLTAGMLSDRFLHRLSRSSWLIIIAFVMAVTQVYFSFTTIPAMFGGMFLLGISYGGTFSVVPTLTSELFGLKYFGANFGFVGLAPAVGSELISVLLAGALNDKYRSSTYITIITNNEPAKNCLGRVCYRYTLFVTFSLCCLSIVSAILLSYRQRQKTKKAKYSVNVS